MRSFWQQGFLALALASSAFSGGLAHNTNQSVDFVRNFAQDAATGVQAVYYNPAGLAFGSEGLHVQIHSQTILQNRTISVSGGKEYEGEAFVPFMPSVFVDYHRGAFDIFGGFLIVGGGGGIDFDDGLPMIDMLLGQMIGVSLGANPSLAPLMQMGGLSASDLFHASFEGTQYIYGFILGGTYKINEMFSLSLGARFNYAVNTYKGKMKSTGALEGVIAPLPEEVLSSEAKTQIKQALSAQLNQTLLDCEQTGFGVTPIIGAHFHYKKLDAGVKFEYNTFIKVENDTKEVAEGVASVLPQFLDGKKTDNDMPGYLSVGLSYALLENLRTSIGYHHYFDQFANYANGKEDDLHHDEKEGVLGIEFDPIERLTLSLGLQRTIYGLSDAYIEDMSFNLRSWSIGGGLAFRVTDFLKIQLGYMETIYEPWTKKETLMPGVKIKKKYERTSHNFGVGVNLDF